MQIFENKKIAIPVLAGIGLLALLAVWWGMSRLPSSGGIQTTNVKGEAALKARADEDNALLQEMSVEDLKAVVQQRKVSLSAAEGYGIANDIKIAKDALDRAEAVLKSKK